MKDAYQIWGEYKRRIKCTMILKRNAESSKEMSRLLLDKYFKEDSRALASWVRSSKNGEIKADFTRQTYSYIKVLRQFYHTLSRQTLLFRS